MDSLVASKKPLNRLAQQGILFQFGMTNDAYGQVTNQLFV
jgi:hypothetical protein